LGITGHSKESPPIKLLLVVGEQETGCVNTMPYAGRWLDDVE